MALSSLLLGRRKSGAGEGLDYPVYVNEASELLVAQGLPKYTELTRQSNGWNVMTSTAFAPVAAVPTTTAALEVHNPSGSANNLVVADLFAFQLLSTAATQTYAIWAQVTVAKAAPTAAALTIASRNGQAAVTGATGSFVVPAVGTTVVANGWRPYGPVQAWGTAAATPGNSLVANVDGALIVPPGRSLCVTVVGSLATASTFQVGAGFYMAALTMD